MPRPIDLAHATAAWRCVFCPRLRLAPWGRPLGNDSLVAECPTCGDVCAAGNPAHALRALAYLIQEHIL